MERVVHPGPIDESLLRLQAEHRSTHLWHDTLRRDSLLAPHRIEEVRSFFAKHPPHERVREYLSRAGLYSVIRVGDVQLDYALVTAMVERWRPETHTFHLPFGEVSITLQDIQVLYGLPVDGRPVFVDDLAERGTDWRLPLFELTGCLANEIDMKGKSRVKISTIMQFLRQELVGDVVTVDTPEDRIQRIARLYMLLLFGGILFPNTSGNLLSLRILSFLRELDLVGTYSWGGAVLAYLYRSLCRASMGKSVDLSGFIPLLQLWTWERILPLQPVPRIVDEALMPYGRRWTRGIQRNVEVHHAILPIRDQLDRLREEQFVWRPYDAILHTLPPFCTVGMAVWTACVPMFYLETVEHHPADRVMRQFGHPPHVPDFPDWALDHYKRDDRMRLDQAFRTYLDDCLDRWHHREIRGVAIHPGARLDTYMDWYLRHGRLLIGNPTLHNVGGIGYVLMAASNEGLVRGLRRLHQQGLDWMMQPNSVHYGETVVRVVLDILHEAQQGRVVQGPTVPVAHYQQPIMVHGRGRGHGRGCELNDARSGGRGGSRKGGRGRARVGGIFIHDLLVPTSEDEPAAEDAHIPDHDPATDHAPIPEHDPATEHAPIPQHNRAYMLLVHPPAASFTGLIPPTQDTSQLVEEIPVDTQVDAPRRLRQKHIAKKRRTVRIDCRDDSPIKRRHDRDRDDPAGGVA